MSNVDGPKASRRRLLSSVYHLMVMYAESIWNRAMEKARTRGYLIVQQRRILLRIILGYQSIFANAVM